DFKWQSSRPFLFLTYNSLLYILNCTRQRNGKYHGNKREPATEPHGQSPGYLHALGVVIDTMTIFAELRIAGGHISPPLTP
ncbi:MAG: hypothetical protein ACXVBF_02805, partial [Flavisolibacter sp.]